MKTITLFIIWTLVELSAVYARGKTRSISFKKKHYVSGSAARSNIQIIDTLIDCANMCIESGQTEFASQAVNNKFFCTKNTSPEKLPQGEWKIYQVKGREDNLCKSPHADTVVLRTDNTTNFDRERQDYKAGFGNNCNLWMGLDKLHHVTTSDNYGIMVNLTAWDDKSFWAYYSSFRVGPESDNYRLSVSGYDPTSTAGDGLGYHNGMQFTTKDADFDTWGGGSCSINAGGGWWYGYCTACNPTGDYPFGGVNDYGGITWYYTPGYNNYYSFKELSIMLIKK